MHTLEHSLIMLLLLTQLLSARPRLSLAAQAAIVGAMVLTLVVPIVPVELPWNWLAAIVLPVLLWQTAQPLVNAHRPFKIEEILLWLALALGMGGMLALTADLSIAGTLLFGVLVASMAWRALEAEAPQASYLGQFGVLTLAFLLTEIDLVIEARDVYALMLLGGAVIGVGWGYASVQIALRLPGGRKRDAWSIAQVYLAYGFGLALGLSGIATAMVSMAAYLVYGARRGVWDSSALQLRPFDSRPIFGAAVAVLAFLGWQMHVALTQPLLLEVGLGLVLVSVVVWLGRILKISLFRVEHPFARVLGRAGLLLMAALLLWPRPALLNPEALALALVVAVAATVVTRWAIVPTLKLYQWLDEAEMDVEHPDQMADRFLVKNALLSKAVIVTPDTPLLELARLLGERQPGCLPVVEADGRLVGLVTESDLFIKKSWLPQSERFYPTLFEEPIALEQLPEVYAALSRQLTAADIMTRKVVWVKDTHSLAHAIRLLMRYDLKCLPVLDSDPGSGGKLIGLITRADIIRVLTADQSTDQS